MQNNEHQLFDLSSNEIIDEFGEITTIHEGLDEDEQIQILSNDPTFPDLRVIYRDRIKHMSSREVERYIEGKHLQMIDNPRIQKALSKPDSRKHAPVNTGRPVNPPKSFGFPLKHSSNRKNRYQNMECKFVDGKRIRKVPDSERQKRYSKKQTQINHENGEYSQKWDYRGINSLVKLNEVEFNLLKKHYGNISLYKILQIIVDAELDEVALACSTPE